MLALMRRLKWRGNLTVLAVAFATLWILISNFPSSGFLGFWTMENRPTVQLRQGKIIGIEVKDSYPQVLEQFLGIPYALPTSGEGRFRPSVPIHASTEDFDASKYGQRCPAGPPDDIPQGEDCLNLNIYRPKKWNHKKKLPVLVYFHGGSFNFGSGSSRQISNMVAWAAEPFIGISFNYRLGAFGFLPSKLTAKEGTLNLGLKDQALLLQWVRDNIPQFGGDINNVTIMGSSAGAHSVGHQLFLNTDKPPLFNRVVMESGAATARAVYTFHHPLHEKQFKEFVTKLGGEKVPEDKLMGYLRRQAVDYVKTASESVWEKYSPSLRWSFQPVIDKDVISVRPIDSWQSGNYHNVPILTGFNTDEGSTFVPTTASTDDDFRNFFAKLLPQLTSSDLDLLGIAYPDPTTDPSSPYTETRPGLGAQFARLAAAYGQFAYISPVRQTAHYASQGNESISAPVYLYHFGASSSVKGGASHGAHAPFVTYNKEIREKSETLGQIAGTMHAYWTSFILTGDPNAVPGKFPDRPKWDRFRGGEREGRLLAFGQGNNEAAGGKQRGIVVQVRDDGFAAEGCRFWSERTGLFEI